MARGKSINLFLMDGDASGRIKCTIPNWTGLAYKIPRIDIDKCKDRDDLKQTGVYFLFGMSDETDKPVVYIGQAGVRKNGEGILYRLQEHRRNPAKDYWTEAIVFTTSNNSFGPTEISYLENKFCSMALEAKRYEVKNGNDPNPGNITEEKECELEEFIDYASVIIGVLGHKLFEPLAPKVSAVSVDGVDGVDDGEVKLYLNRQVKGYDGIIAAEGVSTADGFVVLKGSRICGITDHTISDKQREKREKALKDTDGVLLEDVAFTSPSTAAVFVIGKSANGLTEWKTADGRTLKELEAEKF